MSFSKNFQIKNGLTVNGTEVIAANGTFIGTVLNSGGGGGGGAEVGQVVYGTSAPSTGTWLKTGGYYSKATYSALASAIGDIPDISDATAPSNNALQQFPTVYINKTYLNKQRQMIATNGSVWVTYDSAANLYYSTNGSDWSRTPSLAGNLSTVMGITYANNTFVLYGYTTGSAGILCYSTDGINWTGTNAINTSTVVYHSGYWYTFSGTNITSASKNALNGVYRSTDLTNWTQVLSLPNTSVGGVNCTLVIANGNIFITGLGTSLFYYSANGTTWTLVTTLPNTLTDVVYLNSKYIMISNGVYTSSDLVTFTSVVFTGSSGATISNIVNGICFMSTLQGYATTTDAITFTSSPSEFTGLLTIRYINSTYYLAGTRGVYWTSSDAVTWTKNALATADSICDIIETPSNVFAVGSFNNYALSGTAISSSIFETMSGNNFTCVGVRNSGDYNSYLGPSKVLAYDGSGRYIMAQSAGSISATSSRDGGAGSVITSTDGINWTGLHIDGYVTQLHGVKYVGGRWYVFRRGTTNTIATSTDGTNWTLITGFGTSLFTYADVAYNGTQYVLTTNGNGIYYSTDGIAFTSTTVTTATVGVIWANSIFVAWGSAGTIHTSTDGITWTAQTSQFSTSGIAKIIYENSLFVAVGVSGKISTSTDGTTWVARTSGTSSQLNDIAYSGSLFVAVGLSGATTTSPDGVTWTYKDFPLTAYNFSSAVYFNGKFFINTTIGNNLVSSIDGITWKYVGAGVVAGATNFMYGCQLTIVNSQLYNNSGNDIRYTSDGYTWKPINGIPLYRSGLNIYNFGVQKVNTMYFVCSSSIAPLYASSNMTTWTEVKELLGTTHPPVYFGGYYYCLVQPSGSPTLLYKSSDGISWIKIQEFQTDVGSTSQTTTPSSFFATTDYLILGFPQKNLYRGIFNFTYYSSNGVDWSVSVCNKALSSSIAVNGNTVVAAGSSNSVLLSTDGGKTFVEVLIPNIGQGSPLFYSSGAFYIVGTQVNNSCLFKSTDGIYWINVGSVLGTNAGGAVIRYGNYVTSINASGPAAISNSIFNGDKIILSNPPSTNYAGYGTTSYYRIPVSNIDNKFYTGSSPNSWNSISFPILEFSYFSYDTSTTFFVPAVTSASASEAYICAGT